jgi:hypothetical protein
VNSTKNLATQSLLVAALICSGCGKKSEPVAPPPPSTSVESIMETAPSAPAPPPPSQGVPVEAESKEPKEAKGPLNEVQAATTALAYSRAAGMSMFVQQFYEKNGRVPKDFGELVSAKMLIRVPQAPPGLRYAIDPKTRTVVVVPQ